MSWSGSNPFTQGVKIETTTYIKAEMNATHKDMMISMSNHIIVHKTRDIRAVLAMIPSN